MKFVGAYEGRIEGVRVARKLPRVGTTVGPRVASGNGESDGNIVGFTVGRRLVGAAVEREGRRVVGANVGDVGKRVGITVGLEG